MKSMTGYGEAVEKGIQAKVVVQFRTLNNRHLDIQLRVPRYYLSLEEAIRHRIRQKVNRGRIEVYINRSILKGQGRKLKMDKDLMDQYLRTFGWVKRKLGLKDKIDLEILFKMPDLFYFKEDDDISSAEKTLVMHTINTALSNLDYSRKREGNHLKLDIQSQIKGLQKICAKLKIEARKAIRNANTSTPLILEANTNSTSKESTTGSTLIKFNINEEVVRLKSHVEGLTELVRQRGPVGKKFDFLIHEVQREINTIGSKVPLLPVIKLVLLGKENLENIREQVQNVE